ncbi:hypothetical protein ACHQM5_023987 [Ranunculus cassubicifolius]
MEMADFNNQIPSSSRPSIQTRRLILDSSQFIKRNSKDSGPQAMGSISREWTNEKHSSYLDSMEASFVRRLHSHGYHSMDMLGQSSRLANLQDCNMSLQSNANDLKPSNQFKVLQRGCWKKINFESDHPKNNTDECRVLLENQWVRHFRYDKHQKLASPILQGNDAQNSELIKSGAQKLEICGLVDLNRTASYGAIVSSKKLHASDSHQPDKDYVSSNPEGSDQNFVDEVREQPHRDNPPKAKKLKTTTEVYVAPLRRFLTVDLNLNESETHQAKPIEDTARQ